MDAFLPLRGVHNAAVYWLVWFYCLFLFLGDFLTSPSNVNNILLLFCFLLSKCDSAQFNLVIVVEFLLFIRHNVCCWFAVCRILSINSLLAQMATQTLDVLRVSLHLTYSLKQPCEDEDEKKMATSPNICIVISSLDVFQETSPIDWPMLMKIFSPTH